VLSPQVAGKLLERIRETHIPPHHTQPGHRALDPLALTERELEIFTLLASGKSNQQIGRQLSLSTDTVRNHIKSILAKLHLENRRDPIRWLRRIARAVGD
jgi:DNA-binding NarL/FixJ family response regulator